MELEIRPVTDEEFPAYTRVTSAAFGHVPKDEEVEDWRAATDLTRTVAVFDGGEIVGTAGAWNLDLTLPGLATIPVAGVTAVGVRPTHRRQGLLRRMMQFQLDDVVARGESVAILTASESVIYGRFGYGLASSEVRVAIDSDRDEFVAPIDDPGRTRIVDAATAGKVLPEVHDAARRLQPGDITRSQPYWDMILRDRESDREGQSAAFYAVHEDPSGQADGYVRYRFKHDWEHGLARNEVHVQDLVGLNPTAEASLWRLLLDIDLAATVIAGARPVDEPLRWLLSDPRQLRVLHQSDDIWVRILDVPAALAARRYEVSDRIVVEVTDPFRPSNDGRYVIDGGPDGASCARTDDDADIGLGVAELGALYLGGTSAVALAYAGRVREQTTGAAGRLNRLFGTGRAPFCRTGF